MVQGLAFLSKKSWHTKNLANQEKVWMAEQQKEAEAAKTKELAKQIQQEREQEEMERISGKKTTLDRGIDWMYQGAASTELAKEDAEKQAEEYLLGKEFVGAGATAGDFDDGDQQQGINSVIPTAAEASVPDVDEVDRKMEPSVKDRNENFRLRVEDPMFQVSQRQREKEVNNEKTKALYERVVGPLDDHDSEEDSVDDRKSKKRKKRHKKKHHEKKSSRRRRRRSRSRSASRDRQERHRKRPRSYSRSRSPSEDSRRVRRDKRRSKSEKRRSYDSSDSGDYSSDGRRDYRRYDREKNDRYRPDEHRSKRREGDWKDRSKSNNDHNKHRKLAGDGGGDGAKKTAGYGLKSARESLAIDHKDLGPSRELLQKKRDERDAERRRIRDRASTRQRKSGEERARALQDMQHHAKARDHARKDQDSHRSVDEEAPARGSASFLTDMTRRTHGISGADTASLSARVAQNRHTNQRLHDSFF